MLQKILNISSYIWAFACLAFVAIVTMMTQFFTVDPNLSGGAETPYLIPMLAIIAIGVLFFGIAVLIWIISLLKKIKLKGKHFWISLAIAILVAVISIVFMMGKISNSKIYQKQSYTGQELFNAVNVYRVSNGVEPLKLELPLCDNLVKRYLKIKNEDNVGHDGFEEWVKGEGIDKNYAPVGELYIKDTYTTKDAVEWWGSSPGHRLTLLLKDVSMGCAYASEGTGVLIVGEPIKK
jgi:hypothetical protein